VRLMPDDALGLPTYSLHGRVGASLTRALVRPTGFDTPLLALLLAADAVFVGLHLLAVVSGRPDGGRLSVSADRGFAETFQYVKEYWICGLLVMAAIRLRQLVFAAWAAVFGYLLVDDVVGLHELLGSRLVTLFELSPVLGVRAQDIGELLASMTMACILAGPLAAGHLRASCSVQRESWMLVQMVAALAIVGVGIDVIHEMIRWSAWYHLVSIIEDGGEMVVMSFIMAWSFAMAKRCRLLATSSAC
jgi:hypothetical protein